ncbi:hypothetical protein GCM10028783_16240 [Modestobacter muralis]
MADCCALDPAPARAPLSSGAALDALPPEVAAPALPEPSSLEAPQAARARVAARAEETAAARVVVLSFNSVPFN